MMAGRDLAGCLPLVGLTMGSIISGVVMSSIHHLGLWVWFAGALVTGLTGICLLAYAKLPLYRQGKFNSFGGHEISEDRLTAYKWAWRLIVATMCMQVLLIVITR